MTPSIMSARRTTDRAYDILRSERSPLEFLFPPRAVAVIGASERNHSVGCTVLWNLICHPFGGTVYPLNPWIWQGSPPLPPP
jgi:acetyltransferase